MHATVPRQAPSALAQLWERHRERILGRLAVLEQATLALFEGSLDEDQRRGAGREAHALAASVDSFGLAEGSRLAREIKLLFEDGGALDQAAMHDLPELVVALRRELEQGPTERQSDRRADGEQPTLLIVSDDAALAERLILEAGGRGMRAVAASDAATGREVISRGSTDLVLLESAGGDRWPDRLRLLAELAGRTPPLPAVVLAPRDSFAERLEVARLGARGFLPKSAPAARALEMVERILRSRQTDDAVVLAVADDASVLGSLRGLLESPTLRLTTLDEPGRFWQVLEAVSPDLLVLDADLPSLSGVEACRMVRADWRWAELPIVLLTDRSDAETIHSLFAAGADDYVRKPVVGPELVARIANRLELTQLHQRLAETDALTGLVNRHRSTLMLEQLLRLADRQEQPISLAILDLDYLRRINERHGHAAGDEALGRLGALLARSFRGYDVVARWGGEEFVLGLYGIPKGLAFQRLGDVLDELRGEVFEGAGGGRFRVTFSGGIAQYPDDGDDLPALYRAADVALYQAKTGGRDRLVAVGLRPNRDESTAVDVVLVDDDATLAGLLHQALETRGYRTHWLRDGLSAVEALAGPRPALRARLVVLDMSLPGLDGLSVLRRLGHDGTLDRMRVIMATARATEAEVVAALKLGALDHVAKPFSMPVLLQRIRRALEGEP